MEQEDWYRDDSLRVGRGIVFGVVFGTLIWAVIIGCVVLALR